MYLAYNFFTGPLLVPYIILLKKQPAMSLKNRLIRKSIHLFTGLAIFMLTLFLEKQVLLFLIAAGSLFALATFPMRRFRMVHRTDDASMGTLFYPLGIITAFILLYNHPLHYFQISLLILTVSDTAANLTGQIKSGNIYFNMFREEKSLYGVLGFAITAFLIFCLLLPPHTIHLHAYIILAILLAITFEVISYKGSDNFSIPVGSALFFLIMERYEGSLPLLLLVVLLCATGAVFFFRMGWLTKQAAVVVYFLAIYFLGVLGVNWLLPVLAFFFTSVMLTRVNTSLKGRQSSANRRNSWQVLANIFWAILVSAAYLITGDERLPYLFIALIAAVTADTWASEAGPVFHRRSFSVGEWCWRESGVSGGISLAGSMAGLTGALLIAALSVYLFDGRLNAGLVLMLGMAGFLSSFVDTLLGAFAEPHMERLAMFRKQQGKTEALNPNDLVNLLGSLTAPLFFLLLLALVV